MSKNTNSKFDIKNLEYTEDLESPTSSTTSTQFNKQDFSPENFGQFCDRVGNVVDFVRNSQIVIHNTYDIPRKLQEQLDNRVKELEALFYEIKDAKININRLKMHMKAVSKEKRGMERFLKRLKLEEAQEMEMFVSFHDRLLYSRWDKLKDSIKIEPLENFLQTVEGKFVATKYLKILIKNRIFKLQGVKAFKSARKILGEGHLAKKEDTKPQGSGIGSRTRPGNPVTSHIQTSTSNTSSMQSTFSMLPLFSDFSLTTETPSNLNNINQVNEPD